jgi:hypothetical protein
MITEVEIELRHGTGQEVSGGGAEDGREDKGVLFSSRREKKKNPEVSSCEFQ